MRTIAWVIFMALLPDFGAPAQTASAPPLVSISVNGAGDVDAYRGWPLVVEAVVLPTVSTDAVDGGIALRVTSELGEQIWPLHPAAASSDGSIWYLAPEETGALPAGDYEIVAVLDTAGWGAVPSEPVAVRLRDEPGEPSPEQVAQKSLLNAAFEFTRGNPDQAAARVDELLAAQPDNIDALSLKSDLLAQTGQLREALTLVGQAIQAYYAKYPGRESPGSLLARQRTLLARILGN